MLPIIIGIIVILGLSLIVGILGLVWIFIHPTETVILVGIFVGAGAYVYTKRQPKKRSR